MADIELRPANNDGGKVTIDTNHDRGYLVFGVSEDNGAASACVQLRSSEARLLAKLLMAAADDADDAGGI